MAGKGRGVSAGKAYVEMSLKDDKFKASLDRIKGGLGKVKNVGVAVLKAVGKAFVAATVAAVGMFVAIQKLVQEYANYGDKLQKLGGRSGFSTEFISELKVVHELAGGTFQNLEKGLIKMQRRLANPTYAKKFEDLGYDLEKIKKLEPEKRFIAIADSLAQMGEQERLFAAQEMFGEKAGAELVLTLENGSEAMLRQMALASEWGATITQEQADIAAEYNDTWLEIQTMFKGFTVTVGAYFTPWFQWMLDSFLFVVNNWKRVLKEAMSWVLDQMSELYEDMAFVTQKFNFGGVFDDKVTSLKEAAQALALASRTISANGIPGIGVDPFVPHGEDPKVELSDRDRDLLGHGVEYLGLKQAVPKAIKAASRGGFGAGSAQLGQNDPFMRLGRDQLEQAKKQTKELLNINLALQRKAAFV